MDTETALMFLKSNQPMPPTKNLSTKDLDTYDQVLIHFMGKDIPECIPLFLNSFGEGDAHGAYQLVEDVICHFSSEIVVSHLKAALLSPIRSVRYWCAHISCRFPDKRLREELMQLGLESDVDLRTAAVTALSDIEGKSVSEFLREVQKNECDEDLLEILNDIIANRP